MTEKFDANLNSYKIQERMNQIILGNPEQQPPGVRDFKVTDLKVFEDGESVTCALYPKDKIEMQFFKKSVQETGLDGLFVEENIGNNKLFRFTFANNDGTLDFLTDILTTDIVTRHTAALRNLTQNGNGKTNAERAIAILSKITDNLKKLDVEISTNTTTNHIENNPEDVLVQRHTGELHYMTNGINENLDIKTIMERIAQEFKIKVGMTRHIKPELAGQSHGRF